MIGVEEDRVSAIGACGVGESRLVLDDGLARGLSDRGTFGQDRVGLAADGANEGAGFLRFQVR